jgi:hypothetical protein
MPDQTQSIFTAALRRAGPAYGVSPPLVRHNLGDPDPDPGVGLYQPNLGAMPGFLANIPNWAYYLAGGWLVWKYVLRR